MKNKIYTRIKKPFLAQNMEDIISGKLTFVLLGLATITQEYAGLVLVIASFGQAGTTKLGSLA